MGSKFSLSRMRKELAASTMTTVTTTEFILPDVGTLAASGSSVSSSAAIANHVTMVTAADGIKGVQLPSASNGEVYIVANVVSNQALKLYPSTGSQFNGTPPNASVVISGSTAAFCIYASSSAANAWALVYGGAS
jgi:hypothetical protein